MERQKNHKKTQLLIFLGVAFALPYILGILMGIGYAEGLDISVFPSAQMFYPASGAILAALLTRREDHLIPKRFFIGFLLFTFYFSFIDLYRGKHYSAPNELERHFPISDSTWFYYNRDFTAY